MKSWFSGWRPYGTGLVTAATGAQKSGLGLSLSALVCLVSVVTAAGGWAAEDSTASTRRAFGEYPPAPAEHYSHYRRESRYVPVRDGVKLALDIFRPLAADGEESGPLPVVFYYSRYWRAKLDQHGNVLTNLGVMPRGDSVAPLVARDASGRLLFWDTGRESIPELLRHGYIFVRAEGRGTGASEGIRLADYTEEEARDGADLIEWIARQPWSDGNVGMLGGSYPGITQLHIAGQDPEPLKAIFPAAPSLDLYRLATAGVGVLHKGIVGYRMTQASKDGLGDGAAVSRVVPVDADPDGERLREVLRERAESTPPDVLMRALRDMAPEFVDAVEALRRGWNQASPAQTVATILDTGALLDGLRDKPELQAVARRGLTLYRDPSTFSDSETPGRKSVHLALPRISGSGIPVYIWTGWYDMDTVGSLLLYRNLEGPRKLTAGPWSHGPNEANGSASSPLYRNEEAARRLLTAEALRWFDYWLKGVDTGVMDEPPMQLGYQQTNGGLAWVTGSGWPLPGGEQHAMYLDGQKTGTVMSVNDGGLLNSAPLEPAVVEFDVDYSASLGPQSRYHDSFSGVAAMAYPDLVAHARSALTFTSAPLPRDMLVLGHPVVTLSARSTSPDADLFVYLEDVDGDSASYVSEAVMRGSHRRVGTAPYDMAGLPYSASTRAVVAQTPPLDRDFVQLTADFQPTGYLFRAGHRIRLVITGADADNYITPPTLPEPTISLRLGGAAQAARLELPVQGPVQ